MKTSRFSTISAIALLVGMFACYSIAAPRSAQANKNDAALVDEGDKASEAKSGDTAQKDAPAKEEAAPSQSNPECDNNAKPESGIPVFPIVMSAIGTIAFIVLAIIF